MYDSDPSNVIIYSPEGEEYRSTHSGSFGFLGDAYDKGLMRINVSALTPTPVRGPHCIAEGMTGSASTHVVGRCEQTKDEPR